MTNSENFKNLIENEETEDQKRLREFNEQSNKKHKPKDNNSSEPLLEVEESKKAGFIESRIQLPHSGGKGRKVPTLKQKKWLEETIRTNNPTEAAVIAYDVKDRHSASMVAYDNMKKPYIREELNRMLESKGLSLDNTVTNHKWIIDQTQDISTKLKACQEHYDLVGLHPEEKTRPLVNVGLVINR